MRINRWMKTLPLVMGLVFGTACGRTAPRTLPPGHIPLKVMALKFYQDVTAMRVSPLDGTPFELPEYPNHSDLVVPLDPKRPLPTYLQVVWTRLDYPFRASMDTGGRRPSISHPDWRHNNTVPLSPTLPENPEYLLLVFYPDDSMKAEILSQAQVDGGRFDQIIQEFIKTWPKVFPSDREENPDDPPSSPVEGVQP